LDEQQEVLKEHPHQAEHVYPWLAQFTKPKGPAPKKLSDAQFYMQHPNFIEKFTADFNRQVNDKDMPAALLLDL